MAISLEEKLEGIITRSVEDIGRPDLFRPPLVTFSAAEDEEYTRLKTLIGPWHMSPTQLLPGAKSVVSYFVPFTKAVAAEPKTVPNGSPLWAEAYQEINRSFDGINAAVADFLEGLGHTVKTIRATHTYDPADLKSMWSHRSAAAIAGLGAFGANGLLITRKGSAGRFCSVITSAPLAASRERAESKCLFVKNGSCGLCFRACPVTALTAEGFDKFTCQDELNKNQDLLKESTTLKSADTCGKCISVCPYAYIE